MKEKQMMEPRARRYVAADLEGTLTSGEVWRGLGDFLKANGRAAEHRSFMLGHMPGAFMAASGLTDKQKFRDRWLTDQAQLLHGYTRGEVAEIAESIVETVMWPARREAVIEELARHHAEGSTVILASGTYEAVAAAFGRRLGFERMQVLSTPLEYVEDRCTGKLAGPIGIGAVKAQRVKEVVGDGLLVAAYGDTAADVPMLEASGEAVAVAPDDALRRIAAGRGWRVIGG
jgi:phosphoserine phosphatase